LFPGGCSLALIKLKSLEDKFSEKIPNRKVIVLASFPRRLDIWRC